MPVVPIRQILDAAFAERYGIAAIDIVGPSDESFQVIPPVARPSGARH